MAEFLMPILEADMRAGTLVAWRKQAGDRVTRGEIIAQVETDKGLIDIEVFLSGTIEKILVEPGTTVPTGAVLAVILEDAGAPGAPVAPAVAPPAPARVRISPLARRIATELRIDPETVRGTGPGGAVTQEDVVRAAAAGEASEHGNRASVSEPVRAAAAGEASEHGNRASVSEPVRAAAEGERAAAVPPEALVPPGDRQARLRQTIGATMSRSKREIPHYYLATTIDMHRALAWLAEENLRRPVTERLLYGALLVKAVARAVSEVPELNSVWRGGEAIRSDAVHVGVAISLRGGGVVAPALHDADRQSLGDLMRQFRDLVQRARAGGLRSSELSDPTITVTSLGEQGVETVFGIIFPPQVAIVGFGKVVERAWPVDGAVVLRPVMTATLSADHRVSDGHRGALFLAAVDRLLQEPGRL
ncbi:MAG: branched-chain alpha-keto acid dehydrogenase subunit E2 [Candidatus Rokubacteria bacterium RIFCSPLOWO2_12_FULL_69_21]|nr:MAG: branched-chain alpha-keto acid dehydrogenase subunit E2 [Candidatus Rokubacteria bacterium RIFCSPLOWO2_12_FULL_69_21]